MTPEEAIGSTKRQDHVLIKGKERLLEATVMGCKGQAFTSAQGNFECTLEDVEERLKICSFLPQFFPGILHQDPE